MTPDRPKILYIVSQLGQGGAEQQLYYVLKHLKPNATVVSLASGGYWLKPYQELGYRVIELQRTGSFDVSRLTGVIRAIREQQPDIVHQWMDGIPGIYGRLATFFQRRPTIVGLRTHPVRDPGWYSRLTRLWLNRHITMFVSNAVSSQQYLVDHDHVPAGKSRFIPNGIELNRFAPRKAVELPALLPEDWHDKVVVGTIGALARRKAPEVFVQVARKIIDQNPNVRFLHAGDGPLREAVEQQVRELNLEPYMHFLGSRSDVPEVLRALDILLMTSRNEGTPNAVMEAMATALPCVVTDIGDCKALVVEGATGFVAPIGDVNCLTDYVMRLVNDPNLRQSMGRAGYDRIQNYDVQKMAQQYGDLYQEVFSH
ncbi:MAG: glycosyltransferase [Anaerolineae bacterium]|nr:glycosyltransferase [Anaerolineae bacterium]